MDFNITNITVNYKSAYQNDNIKLIERRESGSDFAQDDGVFLSSRVVYEKEKFAAKCADQGKSHIVLQDGEEKEVAREETLKTGATIREDVQLGVVEIYANKNGVPSTLAVLQDVNLSLPLKSGWHNETLITGHNRAITHKVRTVPRLSIENEKMHQHILRDGSMRLTFFDTKSPAEPLTEAYNISPDGKAKMEKYDPYDILKKEEKDVEVHELGNGELCVDPLDGGSQYKIGRPFISMEMITGHRLNPYENQSSASL